MANNVRVKMGPPRGNKGPIEKAKDFKGTLKRLVKYVASFKAYIISVCIVLTLGTILSIVSPKILGMATTELGNNIMQKAVYTKIVENLPEQILQSLPEDATVKTLIDMNYIPKDSLETENEVLLSTSVKKMPKINFEYIGKILVIIGITYLISALFTFFSNRTMATVAQKITFNMRKEVDEKLDKLPLSFFDKHTHGEILSRITNDIDNISSMFQQSFVQVLQGIITVVGILVMMISINVSLTLVAILMIPASLLVVGTVVKSSQKYFVKQQEILGIVNGNIEETFSGDLVVKAFNMQDEKIEEFEKINEELYKYSWKAQFLSGMMMPFMNVIKNVGYIAICIIGANYAIKGKITIGNIQAFIQYTNQFTHPLVQIANIFNMIQSTIASAERVFEILDEKEESKEVESNIDIAKIRGNVECKNVEFSYSEDKKLIENWSLNVKAGQTVAIVGPTGAGKTTIVNLLMRFYDINSGDILIDGKSIKDMSRKDLRSMFSMVLQDTWLFGGTIKENLMYAKEDALEDEVKRAAYLAHASHFIETLPGGYDFVINDEATNISQGQKQLLTIARAILADSPILILDEATSNVDTRTEQMIQSAMNKLMEGRTSFVIAHRLSTIKNADIIIVMDHGHIVERGTHDELLKLNGYYSKLYNSQFEEEIA